MVTVLVPNAYSPCLTGYPNAVISSPFENKFAPNVKEPGNWYWSPLPCPPSYFVAVSLFPHLTDFVTVLVSITIGVQQPTICLFTNSLVLVFYSPLAQNYSSSAQHQQSNAAYFVCGVYIQMLFSLSLLCVYSQSTASKSSNSSIQCKFTQTCQPSQH